MFLPLFCVVDLETNNSFMPAAAELIMLNRLLIMPGVEHEMLNIWVNLCLLLLRPKGSMVLQGSRITSAPGILWSTPPVYISGVRHSKARSLMWNLLFRLSVGPVGVLVVAPAEKGSLLGSQFDRKQCREQFVTPLSCFPQSRWNSLAFQTSVLLRLLLDLDTYVGVDPLGVFPLFLKMVASKSNLFFLRLIRLGLFPDCLRSANVTRQLLGEIWFIACCSVCL